MNELISVIVPCYNVESLVSHTVSSIRNQSYSNLEIILVDDGSKDGTLVVLQQLAVTDSRIRVIHQENGGVTKARLTGVAAASGEWIGFVDGDDEIELDMYQHLIDNAHKYHADISHCGYQMVFPSRVDYYYNTGRLVEQDKQTGLKDLLSGTFVEPGLVNKLFRKNLFHSLLHDGKMDTSIKINEDLLMNFYLFMRAEKAIYEDICPYHYMVRKGSAATSKVNESKLRDPLLVQRIIKSQLPPNDDLQGIVDSRIAGQLISLATIHLGDQKKLILPYRQRAREELRQMLPSILRGKFSSRIKVLSLWAAICPASYTVVHDLYAHMKGTDRKYEVV